MVPRAVPQRPPHPPSSSAPEREDCLSTGPLPTHDAPRPERAHRSRFSPTTMGRHGPPGLISQISRAPAGTCERQRATSPIHTRGPDLSAWPPVADHAPDFPTGSGYFGAHTNSVAESGGKRTAIRLSLMSTSGNRRIAGALPSSA